MPTTITNRLRLRPVLLPDMAPMPAPTTASGMMSQLAQPSSGMKAMAAQTPAARRATRRSAGGPTSDSASDGNKATFTFRINDPGPQTIGASLVVPGIEAIQQQWTVQVEDSPDEFMKRVIPPQTFQGPGGTGGFDAGLNAGTLEVKVKALLWLRNGLSIAGDQVTSGAAAFDEVAGKLTDWLTRSPALAELIGHLGHANPQRRAGCSAQRRT